MDVAAAVERPSIDIGRIVGGAFRVIAKHPVIIFGLAFVAGAVPTRLLGYFTATLIGDSAFQPGASLLVMGGGMILHTFVSGLLSGITIDAREGDTTSLTISFGRTTRRLIPLLAVSVLYAIGCMISLIALVIPFFFFWIRWSVVGPVAVTEEHGVGAAFGRSSQLTEGVRTKLFGLLLLAAVLQVLLSAIVLLSLLPLAGAAILPDSSTNPLGIAGKMFAETVTIGFHAALQCVLYVELRERRDGPLAQRLSEIFA